jgi:hypothetical protein
MDLTLVLAVLGGVLAGVVVALRVIAPLTRNTVDDKVLAGAEKAKTVADLLTPPKA